MDCGPSATTDRPTAVTLQSLSPSRQTAPFLSPASPPTPTAAPTSPSSNTSSWRISSGCPTARSCCNSPHLPASPSVSRPAPISPPGKTSLPSPLRPTASPATRTRPSPNTPTVSTAWPCREHEQHELRCRRRHLLGATGWQLVCRPLRDHELPVRGNPIRRRPGRRGGQRLPHGRQLLRHHGHPRHRFL